MIITNRKRRYAPVTALAFLAGVSALILGGMSPRASGDESAVSPALKAIQGTWVTSENDSIDAKWVFEGEKLKATVNGMDYTCKVKLDDKAKPHATFDLDITEGPEESKGKTSQAIYKLDGDKLTICVSIPGLSRPKDFEPVPDESYLFELKKEKKS